MISFFKIFKNNSILICGIAILAFLFSCESNESDEGQGIVTYINLNADANVKFVGQEFEFSVYDNENHDITTACTLMIDGEEIEGNTYTFMEVGTYSVVARFDDLLSNEIQIRAELNEGVNFKHRILYEDFTGTWCGYCPIAYVRYEQVHQQNENVVFVGVHGPEGTSDPFLNSTSADLHDFLNISGHPTMYLNRSTLWEYNFNYTDVSLPLSLIQLYSKIGFEVNSEVSDNMVNADINIAFAENYSNVKLVCYIVEDNLFYTQTNYYDGSGGSPLFYEGQYQVENYYHQNVLRACPTGIQGVDVSNANSGEVFSYNFTYSIPSNQMENNLKLIVMILNNEGTVLNVKESKIGTYYPFEYL